MGSGAGDKKPTYLQMSLDAIKEDNSKGGTSKQAILKYISEVHGMDPEKSKLYLTSALKKGVETGHLKMAKESGKGSNSYKIGDAAKEDDKAKKAAKKASAMKAKKAGEEKPKRASEKKAGTAKAAKGSQEKPKKRATPKKSAASRVKDADKPKKTPTKKIGKKAAAKTDKPKKA